MAGECCSAGSGLRQSHGSPAVSSRGFEACSHESGRRGRSRACVCHGGRYGASRVFGARPRETLPSGHADAVALAARDSGAIGAGQKECGCRTDIPASRLPPIELGADCVRRQSFLPLSDVCARRGILGSRTGQCSRRRVPEDSRPQRHRLELLDGSVGASGSGSCQCLAGEEPRRERMPMPPASGRSPPTKISSHSGKTPTPIFPS